MIVEAKERYTNKLRKKLDDPSTMPKEYWSILNTLLNNKKIPNIPPLDVNGKIISNFDKKAKLFNSNFASQSTPIFFFLYWGFLSQPFTNHRTAGEGGADFFNSPLPLPPASHTLTH